MDSVPQGSYTVTVGSVAQNCAVNGGPARAVTVVAGTTANVAFDVTCATAERIAFAYGGAITVMRTDGSSPLVLTPGAAPAWSPDGARLAFECGQDICVIAADGSGSSRVTFDAASNSHPAWSPDGSKIAFAATHAGVTEMYVMGANGLGVVQVTHGVGFLGSPAWSPDGTRIAFDCLVAAGNDDICVVNADGTGFARLTSDPGVGLWRCLEAGRLDAGLRDDAVRV